MSVGFRRFCTALAMAALACSHQEGPPSPAASDADDTPPASADAAAPDKAAPALDLVVPPDLAPAPVEAGAPADTALPGPDVAVAPAAVLIYTRADAFVHPSRTTAAMAIKKALEPKGITATISEDPALIATDKLAPLGGVILIDTTGKPFGNPGTAAIEALGAFVRGGRGLVGIHAASSGYDGVPAYVSLIGGHFNEHPGGVRLGHCQPMGDFPSVARLPATFSLVDEFYVFDQYNDANLVDLRCDALGSPTKLPIAWHRLEGQGRVFYTALGHGPEEWSDPKVLDDHVIPGILWALNRGP